jgi:hypothetical protein
MVDVPTDALFVGASTRGVPAKVVAQIMGQTKVDTTMNVYTESTASSQ